MNIIIAGGGKVGAALVRQLTSEGCDITVIDSNPDVLENLTARFDVIGAEGNSGCSNREGRAAEWKFLIS